MISILQEMFSSEVSIAFLSLLNFLHHIYLYFDKDVLPLEMQFSEKNKLSRIRGLLVVLQ